MVGRLQPLANNLAIVGPDGKPTEYFIRWAQQRQIDIGEAVSEARALEIVQAFIDDYALQAGSGISITPDGKLTSNPTISAEAQAILNQISSTRGTILFRGATNWQALAPGTSGHFLRTNGANADPSWAAGGGGGGSSAEAPFVQPSASAFTQRTGTTGVIADYALGISLSATGTNTNTNDLTYCVQSTPTPGPGGWRATGRFTRAFPLVNWPMTGMILRDSVSGRSRLYSIGNDLVSGINRNQYTNDTTFNSVTGIALGWVDLNFWMRIEDDLTNHRIFMSSDGYNWTQVYQETRTTWMTPNQVGFHLNPNTGGSNAVNLRNQSLQFGCLSWEVVTL